jgi:hypothetical protein
MHSQRSIRRGQFRSRVLAATLLVVGAAACSGNDGGVIPDPPLAIAGDYDVTVATALDTCGFGGGTIVAPMQVDEEATDAAEVDLPIGGSGECNRQDYERVENTLTRIGSAQARIGTCPVVLDVTTVLEFHADLTVTGSETNTLTILDAGACPGLADCTIELVIDGARCAACFSCVPPPGSAGSPWGSLALAARRSGPAPAPFAPD